MNSNQAVEKSSSKHCIGSQPGQNSSKYFLFLCSLGVLWSILGCSKMEPTTQPLPPPKPTLDDQTVAIVGDRGISLEDYNTTLNRKGAYRTKQEVLDEMIRFETALTQAKMIGMDKDPELLKQLERTLVNKYMENQLKERLTNLTEITSEEVSQYYQDNPEKYGTPERFRAGIIFIAAAPKASPEKQAHRVAKVQDILKEVSQTNDVGFAALAVKHSEDQATRYAGGNSGWINKSQSNSRWESPVLEAIFALTNPGEVAPVVYTDKGHYIVRLYAKTGARLRPLKDVEQGIRYQINQSRRQAVRDKLHQELRQKQSIEVNQSVLDSIPEPQRGPSSVVPGVPQ